MTSRDETLLLLEGGRDVETNVSEEVENKSHRKKKKPLIIVGGIIGLFFVLCGCFFLWWFFTREDKPGTRKLEKPVQGNLQGNSSGSNPPGSNDLSHTNEKPTRESPEPTEVNLPASPVNTATHPLTGLTEPFNQEEFCTQEYIPDLRKEECKLSTLNQRGLEEKYTEQRMKNAKNWEEYCDNVLCDYVINRTEGKLVSDKSILKKVKTVVSGYVKARTAAAAITDGVDTLERVNKRFFFLLLKATVKNSKRRNEQFRTLVTGLQAVGLDDTALLALFTALDDEDALDSNPVEVFAYINKLNGQTRDTLLPFESLLLPFVGHMYRKVEADKLNPSDTLSEDLVKFANYLNECTVDGDNPNRLKVCHRMLDAANATPKRKKGKTTMSWEDVQVKAEKLIFQYKHKFLQQCNSDKTKRGFNLFCRAHLKFYPYSELEETIKFLSVLYEKRKTWGPRCFAIGIHDIDISAKFPPKLGYYKYDTQLVDLSEGHKVFSKCELLFQRSFDYRKSVQEAYEKIELTAFMLEAERKFLLSTDVTAADFTAQVDKRNQFLLAEVRLDFTRHCTGGKNYDEQDFDSESVSRDALRAKCAEHLTKLNEYFQVNEQNYSEMRQKLVTALNAVY